MSTDEQSPPGNVGEIRKLFSRNPVDAQALRSLARALAATSGKPVPDSGRKLRLAEADQALRSRDLERAEVILRDHLLDAPADFDAVRLLAEFARQLGMPSESEALLRYAVELVPDDAAARLALAGMILRQGRYEEGVCLLDELLAQGKAIAEAQRMKASALYQWGHLDEAEALYRALLEREPAQPGTWVSYGRLLKSMGRGGESADAFTRAIDLNPRSGVAWWSLSDLKSARFKPDQIELMRRVLQAELGKEDRFHILFALAKALEDEREDEAAFRSYAEANAIRRSLIDYKPDALRDFVSTSEHLFTKEFFDRRKDGGLPDPAPIFIVGVTRSGSTLIEQILSSHSLVEGTMELPFIPEIARSIAANMQQYLTRVMELGDRLRRELGGSYLQRCSDRRASGKPHFTDKMPLNWMHVPLIRLILPRARIIDARRHPLGCGWSNFKQHYATGQAFTYDLNEFGRYYSDYARMMDHIDTVQPGLVHRVFYERMVEQPETEIRRLLNFLDLPFEQSCLEFHKTKRTVMTPSAEQVRRPINRGGLDQWRRFEAWLGPLKAALGPVLTNYPER